MHFEKRSNDFGQHFHLHPTRSSCQFPIQFSKLTLQLSNPAYNAQCVVTDGRPLASPEGVPAIATPEAQGDLYLMPGQVKMHQFQFAVLPEDVGRKLEVSLNAQIVAVIPPKD